jgi:hypothetical protein
MESWHVCPESPLRYEDVIGAIEKVKGEDPFERAVFSRLFDVLPPAALRRSWLSASMPASSCSTMAAGSTPRWT